MLIAAQIQTKRKRQIRRWIEKNKTGISLTGFARRALFLNAWIPRKIVI